MGRRSLRGHHQSLGETGCGFHQWMAPASAGPAHRPPRSSSETRPRDLRRSMTRLVRRQREARKAPTALRARRSLTGLAPTEVVAGAEVQAAPPRETSRASVNTFPRRRSSPQDTRTPRCGAIDVRLMQSVSSRREFLAGDGFEIGFKRAPAVGLGDACQHA